MSVPTITWFSELYIINIYSENWVVYSVLLLEVPMSEMFKFLYKRALINEAWSVLWYLI